MRIHYHLPRTKITISWPRISTYPFCGFEPPSYPKCRVQYDNRTPGKSFTRPPRIKTIACSCKLWPTPGMYAVTSIPLVSRTRATLRRAEFGFFGVEV